MSFGREGCAPLDQCLEPSVATAICEQPQHGSRRRAHGARSSAASSVAVSPRPVRLPHAASAWASASSAASSGASASPAASCAPSGGSVPCSVLNTPGIQSVPSVSRSASLAMSPFLSLDNRMTCDDANCDENEALYLAAIVSDPDPVPLSALNHWVYCPRRCGLIHQEGEFADNIHTARGNTEHERVDRVSYETLHSGARAEYALPVWSDWLGLIGKCDVVEFWPDGEIYPVEYKGTSDQAFWYTGWHQRCVRGWHVWADDLCGRTGSFPSAEADQAGALSGGDGCRRSLGTLGGLDRAPLSPRR